MCDPPPPLLIFHVVFYNVFFVFWLGQSQHLNGRGGSDQVEGRSIKAQPRPENKPSHIRTSQEQDQIQDQPVTDRWKWEKWEWEERPLSL